MSEPTDSTSEECAADAPYHVELSVDALNTFLDIPNVREAQAVDKTLGLLAAFPRLGHLYDPLYEAARPPFELYVTHAGRFGIYYEISDATRTVSIAFIEDMRRDPAHRFGA